MGSGVGNSKSRFLSSIGGQYLSSEATRQAPRCPLSSRDVRPVEIVKHLRRVGFTLIWFDGDRDAAFKAFEKRVKSMADKSDVVFYHQMTALYMQMCRIEASRIVAILNPAIVNPFDSGGRFRTAAQLLEEIERA